MELRYVTWSNNNHHNPMNHEGTFSRKKGTLFFVLHGGLLIRSCQKGRNSFPHALFSNLSNVNLKGFLNHDVIHI